MDAIASRLVPVFEQRAKTDRAETDGVLVAIPAYNEERFIGSVIHGVLLEGFECLVIDDGSTDRTVEIAKAAGATVERLAQNGGKSAAVRRALQVARRRGVNVLVLMDGDWQHDPREIDTLLQPLRSGEAEIVSGSRFLMSARRQIPSVRGIGLRALTAMSNLASGHRVTDSQTGFHAFSRKAIRGMRLRSNGFSVEVEVQFLSRALSLRHVEVPISARYEDPPKRNVFGQGARVLDGIIHLVAYYRPLLFFGVPSLSLLVMGGVLGVVVVDIYESGGQLAFGYALISVLFIILGAIGMFAGLVLHVLRGIYLGLEHQLHSMSHAFEESTATDER
jgi:glycosyltransferase involved in cell wall biosynthesis